MFARNLIATSIAYCAAVMVAALLSAGGFWLVFKVASWDLLTFLIAGIFVLSLPLSLLRVAFRGTATLSLSGAVLMGCINGVISSILFFAVAAFLGPFIMLPAGGAGGAVFWLVKRRLSRA